MSAFPLTNLFFGFRVAPVNLKYTPKYTIIWSKYLINIMSSDQQQPIVTDTSVPASAPKRIIICCDGTWQSSVTGVKNVPSNVTRLSRNIARAGRDKDG